MYAKLVNKRYKPSTIKKDENLTIKQKLTKFLVVRINKEKQYFLNQQYVKKDNRYQKHQSNLVDRQDWAYTKRQSFKFDEKFLLNLSSRRKSNFQERQISSAKFIEAT